MKTIRGYSIEEYCAIAQEFHGGHLAPGMVLAGFMVDLACANLPEGTLFEVICETVSCMPDAVQLLTPCSMGNQWLKIIDAGRFAMSFYDKYTGKGLRVTIDGEKLNNYPAIAEWHFKLKDKHEQSIELLIQEIVQAGTDILAVKPVAISPEYLGKQKKTVVTCSVCGEAFRTVHETVCPDCSEHILPYLPD